METNILHKNVEQSSESSDLDEDYDKKTNRYRKDVKSISTEYETTVKSRSIESERPNEKTNRQISQTRSVDNGISENKRTIRQPSVPCPSIVDKIPERKRKTLLESSEVQAVDNSDNDSDN